MSEQREELTRDREHVRAGRDRPDELITSEELRDDGTTMRRTENGAYVATGRQPTARDDRDRDVDIPEAYNLVRDRVRWGPIWAGLLTALAAILLLSLLGLALGLTALDAGRAVVQGNAPNQAGWLSALWGGLTAIVAFLLGGYVAGKTAAIFDRKWGAFNGALVFLLTIPVTLLLAGLGLGAILGTLGNYVSALNIDLAQLRDAAQSAANQAGQAAQNAQPADVARIAENARYGAWGTLIGLLLGLGAAALGGALGTRRELAVNRASGKIDD